MKCLFFKDLWISAVNANQPKIMRYTSVIEQARFITYCSMQKFTRWGTMRHLNKKVLKMTIIGFVFGCVILERVQGSKGLP